MGQAKNRKAEAERAPDIARANGRLVDDLREQIGFIRSSASAVDAGVAAEAKRIATAVRVLVHDTKTSQSLLGQLHLKSPMRFLDTADVYDPRNLASTFGLISMPLTTGPDGATLRYVPRLGEGPPSTTRPFDQWWTRDMMRAKPGIVGARPLSRRHLVLTLENNDGGAHIDPDHDPDYVILAMENGLGWMTTPVEIGQPPVNEPHSPSLRQIAFELEQTFAVELPRLLPDAFACE